MIHQNHIPMASPEFPMNPNNNPYHIPLDPLVQNHHFSGWNGETSPLISGQKSPNFWFVKWFHHHFCCLYHYYMVIYGYITIYYIQVGDIEMKKLQVLSIGKRRHRSGSATSRTARLLSDSDGGFFWATLWNLPVFCFQKIRDFISILVKLKRIKLILSEFKVILSDLEVIWSYCIFKVIFEFQQVELGYGYG